MPAVELGRACATSRGMTALAHPITQARELVPLLARHAREAEQLRRPHDAVIAALEEARLFSLLTPASRQGRRLPLTEYLETIATLGEGCLSSAWVCSFYAVHAWMVCLFDEATQHEALQHGGIRAPGLVAPSGMARPVHGGFVLSGRWPFGSGAAHGAWALISAVVRESPEAPPTGARLFLVPRSDFEVIDTWDMDGMAATGSHDVAVHEAFVPEARALDVVEMATGTTPGAALFADDPLFRLPMPPLLAFVAAAPALGAARASLREFIETARQRQRSWARGKHFQRPAIQMRAARADMQLRCAEMLMQRTAVELERLTPHDSIAERARLRMQSGWVLGLCTEIVQSIAEAAGAGAHRHDEPLQRRLRDLRVMRCHVIFEPDATAEVYGRTLFDLDPETLLL